MRLLNIGTSIVVLACSSLAFAGWQDSGLGPPAVYMPADASVPPSLAGPACCPPAVSAAPVVAAPAAYRPLMALRPLPPNYAVGRGILGQPKVFVPGQPVRNFVRYISPLAGPCRNAKVEWPNGKKSRRPFDLFSLTRSLSANFVHSWSGSARSPIESMIHVQPLKINSMPTNMPITHRPEAGHCR